MAALRGPTSTRKSSRLSSPATLPRVERETVNSVNEVARARETSKTFLDQWIEPPIRAAAPSFEDHRGLERVGVLEHFQPLGQPPTQKLMQKLKLAPPRPGRATPVQSEEVSTPTTHVEEMSIASPAEEPLRVHSADESTMRAESIPPTRVHEENDADYRPAVPPALVITRPKMPPRNSVSIPPTPLPTGGYLFHGQYHPETIKQHVEAAVRRAELQSPDLALGIRKLCADSELDPALWAVLDAVLNQSASKEQWRLFRRYVKQGKKEYSRHSTPTAKATSLALAASNQRCTPTQTSSTPTKTAYSAPVQLPEAAPPFSQPSLQPAHIFHPQPTLPVQPPSFPSPPKHPPTQPSPVHQDRMPSPIISAPPVAQPLRSSSPEQAANKSPIVTNGENVDTRTFQEGLQNLERTSPKRSQSVSSSSSLSSAKSLDAETFAPAINEEAQINGTRAAAKSGLDQRQAAADKPGANKSRASKIGLFSVFPNTNKANARKQQAGSEIDELELSRRRQRLQQNQTFHEDYTSRFYTGESSERAVLAHIPSRPVENFSTSDQVPIIHSQSLSTSQDPLSSPADTLPSADFGLRDGISKKRSRDETEIDEEEVETPRSSPGLLLVPPPPGAASISRSGTPRGTQMPPTKKAKKSARVMVSPNKPRNGGIGAGFARAGPGRDRDSTVGNGIDSSEEENNDFCAACGSNGRLLCCDGCPNSFHFSCLDPPMKGPPEGSWYCSRCVARQNRGPAEVNGFLGRLITESDDINPMQFGLPAQLEEYFDGIRSGERGEYEDVGLSRTHVSDVKMNRAGFIEEPDYKRLKDAKGNVIFCYRCRLTSNGKRDIIPCDFCPYRWHLDCLDPPLAVPPRRRHGDKLNATWRCPLHIDNDLRNLGNSEGSGLGRQPRHRIPKNPIPVDVGISRGFRNNGIIDVELMKDDERIDDVEMLGTIYRLPEKGIRLDFLERIRRSRYEDMITRQQYATRVRDCSKLRRPSNAPPSDMLDSTSSVPNTLISNAAAANTTLRAKTLREQQAVLSLQALAQQDEVSETVLGNQIADLTDKLILGAGEDVVGLAEKEEREQLEIFRGLVEKRLSILKAGGKDDTKSLRSNGGGRVVVNGAGKRSRGSSPLGIVKSTSTLGSKSKSRGRH